MPKKYYCDYCKKSFQDTPKARKRHFTGQSHLRQRKYYYETAILFRKIVHSIGYWEKQIIEGQFSLIQEFRLVNVCMCV